MRLIDILNKIANGELKEGTKVIWDDKVYISNGKDILRRAKDFYFFDLLEDVGLFNLNDEVELIEPQEPTECEHEWENYAMYNPNTGESRDYRKCAKCDLEEEIEPTDNTTEKIEELIDWYATTNDDKSTEMLLHIVWNKLNEVIIYINKENNNE